MVVVATFVILPVVTTPGLQNPSGSATVHDDYRPKWFYIVETPADPM